MDMGRASIHFVCASMSTKNTCPSGKAQMETRPGMAGPLPRLQRGEWGIGATLHETRAVRAHPADISKLWVTALVWPSCLTILDSSGSLLVHYLMCAETLPDAPKGE